ncbi:hypothetical protein JZ751_011390 [Albula glossodonta]|uniref:Uncharacterized protein n=1 Tax=Albula glossodonta TaxID=121402 RepID=A0A8T2N077_9TELE|nr:hypothetical protein JZ751_011390 [Albula glossodonta]
MLEDYGPRGNPRQQGIEITSTGSRTHFVTGTAAECVPVYCSVMELMTENIWKYKQLRETDLGGGVPAVFCWLANVQMYFSMMSSLERGGRRGFPCCGGYHGDPPPLPPSVLPLSHQTPAPDRTGSVTAVGDVGWSRVNLVKKLQENPNGVTLVLKKVPVSVRRQQKAPDLPSPEVSADPAQSRDL